MNNSSSSENDQRIISWAQILNQQAQNEFDSGNLLLPDDIWKNSVEQYKEYQKQSGGRLKKKSSLKKNKSKSR